MDTINARIKYLRTDKGLSMGELGKAIGVSSGNISDWESGRSKPGSKSLVTLCKYFNVNEEWLLEGQGPMRQDKEDMHKNLNTIGARIAYLRAKNDVSQRKLAKDLGLSSGNISSYESDKFKPATDVIVAIAQYFKVSTDWILTGKESIQNDIKNSDEIVTHISNAPLKFDPVVEEALKDDPELQEFWGEMIEREDLRLLFKKTRPLKPKTVKQIIAWIKAIEDAEAQED